MNYLWYEYKMIMRCAVEVCVVFRWILDRHIEEINADNYF